MAWCASSAANWAPRRSGSTGSSLPPGATGLEHDETRSGQEEVLVVVRGSGHWLVDESEVPAHEGDAASESPDAVRCPVAGPDGMTFVAVGSPRGNYRPARPVLVAAGKVAPRVRF